MKVLMIAPYPYPGNPIKGGVETVSYNLVEGFKNIPDVELLVLSICQQIEEEVKLNDNVTIRYVKSISSRRKIELAKHIKPLILQINADWNPDIIHIQGNGSSLLLYDKSFSNKLVVTQHGILKKEIITTTKLRPKFNMLLALMIENRIKQKIKNWVFISRYNQNIFLNKGRQAPIKYTLIYNPVNPLYFTSHDNNINQSEIRLLYVGRIKKGKGLVDLISAMSLYKGERRIVLDVVGGFDDSDYEREVWETIKINNLEDNVVFHGWKKSDEIIAIERSCHALVLPSYQEVLPCVIAEAMALGKPAIATETGGIPEMIEGGKTGFMFSKGDVRGLLASLLSLQNLSQSEYSNMSDAARKKAMEFYEPTNVAQKHVEFYKTIMQK